MRRLLTAVLMALICETMGAQLYTSKHVIDKFEDVLSLEEIKTIVDIDETKGLITIETKGSDPVVMHILFEGTSTGTIEEPTVVYRNLYGYERTWCIYKPEDADKVNYLKIKAEKLEITPEELVAKFKEFGYTATKRVLLEEYTNRYKRECFWIEDLRTSTRQVYTN